MPRPPPPPPVRSEREAEKLVRENEGLLHRADAYLASRYPVLKQVPQDQRLTILSSALFRVCLRWESGKAPLPSYFMRSLDNSLVEMLDLVGAVHRPQEGLLRKGPVRTVSLEAGASGPEEAGIVASLPSKGPRSVLAKLAEGEPHGWGPALQRALATLSPRQRQVIEALYMAENPPSMHKLARKWGLSWSTLQWQHAAALESLHRALTGKPRPKRRLQPKPVSRPKKPRISRRK